MADASKIRGGNVFIEVLMNSAEAIKEVDKIQKRLDLFAANTGKVSMASLFQRGPLSAESALMGPAMAELKHLQDSYNDLAADLGNVGLLFSGIGAGITVPLALATKSFAAAGDAVDKLGKRTGASVESLSALEYAADQTGASFGAIESGAESLYSAIGKAIKGNTKAIASFKTLGLRAEDLAELPLDKQLVAIAGGMSRLSTSAEKASAATRLFGGAGFQLLPMLKDGAAEMEKNIRRAKELGAVMSKEAAESAVKLTDALTETRTAFRGLNNSIGEALAPMATGFAESTTEAVAFTSSIIRSSPGVVQFASVVGSLTAALGGAGLGLAGVTKAAALSVSGFRSAKKAYDTLRVAFTATGDSVWSKQADGIRATTLAYGALAIKVAAAAAALYGIYKAYQLVANNTKDMENYAKSSALNAPMTPGSRELERAAKGRYKRGHSSDAIQSDFQNRYDKLYAEYKGLNQLQASGGASDADLARLEEVKTKMQDLTLIIEKIKAAGGIDDRFFTISGPTIEQQEAFNASLEKTREKLDEINQARAKQSEVRAFESMIETAPDAANTIINEKADAALKAERDIHNQIVKLKEKQLEATKDEMPELQKQVALLGDQAVAASKRVDEMEDWRRKSVSAVEDVKKRAGEMADQFARLESANATRAQEKAFRKLLDSGNWKQANEQVVAEMVQLEAAWAKNTAAVTDALAKAMNGNLAALEELKTLHDEQQELSTRRETLEDRTVDVEQTKKTVDDAKRNVMSVVDPERSAAENRALYAELKKQLEDQYKQIKRVEASGGDASMLWVDANKKKERMDELKAFIPNRDEMAGSLAGGTFSGEAASRMGGGGGSQLVDLAKRQLEEQRKQLEEQRKTNNNIKDLRDDVRDGGLGV